MLSNAEHPVAWAMLLYELADAHEHLGTLVAQMSAAGKIDEVEYGIHLGHVIAHLNRAWHGRSDSKLDDTPADLRDERSKFPTDLSPVG